MYLENKLYVLKRIAFLFNTNQITWAVGASLLLYFKGIVNDFHDIDIVIGESDVGAVQLLLADIGTLQQKKQNAQYKTKAFLEYVVDGVEIDIMAGLNIVAGEKEHYFPLEKEGIHEIVELDDVRIPLQSIEDWRTYYTLIGRTEKVNLIEKTPVKNRFTDRRV